MENLALLLENCVASVVNHVHEQIGSNPFKCGLEQYLSILEPSVKRYQHHLGSNVSIEKLRKRYEYETALLHILTSVFSHNMQAVSGKQAHLWPVFEQKSPYRWYQLPQNSSETINQLAIEFLDTEFPELIASEVSGHILDKVSSRYLGEFYTPLPIVEHLIQLSGFQFTDLITCKHVIDPACGGGIILTVIANKVIVDARKQKLSPNQILQSLSQNLFGFDIQPFAVVLTKSLLIYSCLPLFAKDGFVIPESLFPNIKLQDALLAQQHWTEGRGFDYIIGNPPFMSTKRIYLDYIENYKEVLYGHPNLYQLFLWWAVRATTLQGMVSFLLPQSMLTGNYFKNLREKLDRHTKIVNITRIIDRKGVIGKADQQMMAVCLEVNRDESTKRDDVNVRITRNGADISSSRPCKVKYSRIVQRVNKSSVFWVVSDHIFDYTICERLDAKCTPLIELKEAFKCGNGGYVWNQNKELLTQEQKESSLPLISAASIELYGFTFPYIGPHASHKRPFSFVNEKIQTVVHSQPALLIQRTTPRKVGRRLVVGMPPDEFHAEYPRYFLENHVNYIKVVVESDIDLLYGLMGWLNSDLINFAFQLRNGSAQVSLFELGLLPVNLKMVKGLASQTMNIVHSDCKARLPHIHALNEAIFDWFRLGPMHRKRIADVLSRKERADVYVRE